MRVAPLAIRFYDDQVLLAAQVRRSAGVTHAHPEGIDGAVVQAAAIAAALDDDDILAVARGAARTVTMRKELDATRWPMNVPRSGVPPTAARSVAAAVRVASGADDFEQAVSAAVRLGGDTDTVAAMAGAIAGARFGAGSIPERWSAVLEDGERGRSHVVSLADALIERAVQPVTGTRVGR